MTSSAPAKKIAVLGVPIEIGASQMGTLMGPDALRTAGLLTLLEGLGFAVEDHGNLSVKDVPPLELHVVDDLLVERDRRLHALDDELVEVMVLDQVNHKTRHVAVELSRDELRVSISPEAAARLVDGLAEPFAADRDFALGR